MVSKNSGMPDRVEAAPRHDADADAVGFVLVLAREVDLLLGREALRRADRTHRRIGSRRADAPIRIAASIAAAETRLARPCVLDAARDVPLGDVRDLVREHARQLALAVGLHEQAGVARR